MGYGLLPGESETIDRFAGFGVAMKDPAPDDSGNSQDKSATKLPRPAEYLLRFDGFCPMMSFTRWRRFSILVDEFRIRPILAVIPDNQDSELMVSKPDPEFWERVRCLEAAGATIAMHGYRHLCASRGRSLIGWHRETEFAGVSEREQREWVRNGLEILRSHGLTPRLFVAPRRGLDHGTMSALAGEGLNYVSDGFALAPYTQDGITFIPQQISKPVWRSEGLWTIGIRSSSATNTTLGRVGEFLRRNSAQLTCFDRVISEYKPEPLGRAERLFAAARALRMRFWGD
jgi:predicted deacetylase